MEIDFSKPEKAEESLKEATAEAGENAVVVRDEKPVEDLYTAVKLLKDKASWVKNIGIENQQEEKERFLERDGYNPEFEFKKPEYSEAAMLDILGAVTDATSKIDDDTMDRYGSKKLRSVDLQEMFESIFEELSLWVRLASNIEDRESWKRFSELLWPLVDGETAEKSRKRLEELEAGDGEKNVGPSQLKKMMEAEVERLGMDYEVETREISGCFNIPEDRKLVVAEGENRDREYSEREAEMITVHEVFHAARSFNGFKAGRDSGFPPVLGIHTPFYDRIDEGGAVYREYAAGVSYEAREHDYHLRLLAAYHLDQGLEFSETVDKLVELGGTRERAFDLAARNRSLLRHHIYWAGYRDWKQINQKRPLLIGKVNQEWAEKLYREVEAGGMIAGPKITGEELFSKYR